MLSRWLTALCDVAWWDGVPVDRARQIALDARTDGARAGNPLVVASADRLAGVLAWRSGDLDAARDLLVQARDGFAGITTDYESARTNLVLARLAAWQGRHDDESETAGLEVYRRLRIAHDATLDLLPG